MTAPTWTKDQRAAVTSPRRALLVSAAAGSGKTRVLADRCVWLVCDAPEPCNIDQLLVVTFTRAAAAEMRHRINESLRKRATQSNDLRLEHQLRIIDRAAISTLDSFCAALLRENFVAAGVDPDFSVLDDDQARLLRLEAGQATLDSFFKSDRRDLLYQLLRIHFDRDESDLIGSISHVHNVLTSVVDPNAWLDRQQASMADPRVIEQAITQFYEPLKSTLPDVIKSAQKAADVARADAKLVMYLECAQELEAYATKLLDHVENGRLDQASIHGRAAPVINFTKGPRNELKKKVVAILEPVRKLLGREGDIGGIVAHSPSDLKASTLESALRLKLFIDLVRDFESRYTSAKRSVHSLDYADLNRTALKLLQSPEDPSIPSPLARALHDRFQHVMVDECQDNNPIQDEILRLLSTEAYSQVNPSCISNLFSVGDVKQSIYGFRLANPAQFIARSDELALLSKTDSSRGARILLRENFRSRGKLLGAVNQIFERLMTRDSAGIDYDDTHALLAGLEHHEVPGGFTGRPIEFHVIESEKPDHQPSDRDSDQTEELDASETEAHLIAHRIHQLMGWAGTPRALVLDETDPTRQKHRPIELGDIAILLRSARGTAGALAGDLRTRGISVHLESASGFFESIEVLDVLSLLQVADNSTRDIALAALIRSPFSEISDPESLLAKVRLAAPDLPFYQAVHGQRESDLLRDFFERVEGWRARLRDDRLDRAIERIVDEAGYLNWLSGLRDGAQRIANVQELIRRAQTFSTFERQGVSRFIEFLRELEAERDLDLPSAASQSRSVVRIMTVHKSKGLEFPVVIVPDLGRMRNAMSLYAPILIDRVAGLGIKAYESERHVRYPSLFYRLVSRAINEQEIAEELRIFYVALTRAREHLILIGSGAKTDEWREEWADHSGPLPIKTIRSARTMLERLGPVAALVERDAPGNIQIISHSPSEIASLPPARQSTEVAPALKRLAQFEPIDRAPEVSTELLQSVGKMSQTYSFQALTVIPSAQAVTMIKQLSVTDQPARLHPPRFAADSSTPNAAERGIAAHKVFQHLDYRRLNSADEIRAQLRHLIDRQILNQNESAVIDIDSILWFGQTDLCRAMNAPRVKLLRELSVYIAEPCETMQTPLDQLLRRGRLDVAMIEPDGAATVIDFKTDRLVDADLADRSHRYRGQLVVYCDAMTRMLGAAARGKLVFLGAKQVVDV